ncbi:MAG: hypothetical protein KDD42_05860 [Bdellovibrionales bacterium]|nr:hypothetical protein [Bdellovibrionales bacterium]
MFSDISFLRNATLLRGVLLIGLCLLPFSLAIDLVPIGSSTEAREAHVAGLMLHEGSWILPTRNGILPSKPPLYHWCVALLSEAVSLPITVTARLVSIICSLGYVLMTLALAKLLTSRVANANRIAQEHILTAVGIILSLTYGFAVMIPQIRVDMLHAFLSLTATYFFFRGWWREGEEKSWEQRGAWNGFFIFSALAVLARGPLGVVMSLLVVFAVLSAERGMRQALTVLMRPRQGWILFSLIVTPWYLMAFNLGETSFLKKQIFFENFQRFFGGDYIVAKPFWYYLPGMLRTTFPWCLLLVFSYFNFRRESLRSPADLRASAAPNRLRKILLLWLGIVLIFLSLSSGKRISYLLPLYAPFSILVGWESINFYVRMREVTRSRVRNLFSYTLMISPLVFLIIVLAITNMKLNFSDPALLAINHWLGGYSYRFLVASVALLSVLSLLWYKLPQNRHALLVAISFYFTLNILLQVGFGIKNHLKGFPRMAEKVNKIVGSDQLTVVRAERDETFDPLLIYLKRHVLIASPHKKVLSCPSYFLARADWFRAYSEIAKQSGITLKKILKLERFFDSYCQRVESGARLFDQRDCAKPDRSFILFQCENVRT